MEKHLRKIKTPADVFTLMAQNPSGLAFTRALYIYGFITYEKFIELRTQLLVQNFRIIK